MLSIKSISATDTQSLANYYESLASVDDYYDSSQEPPGYWLGRGSETLNLYGQLNEGQLLKILQGFHPVIEKPLVENAGVDHKPGWDCTFSCPKSVSAMWAITDESLREEIENAHKKSVLYAVGYLERKAISTRFGQGGSIKEPVIESGGIVAVGFDHSFSRAQDPQLHTHAIIANVTPDGRSIDLDTYHKMTAGALYRVELASRISAIGFSIKRDEDSFKVEGIPESLIEKWSTRRAEILKELARTGNDSSKAAEVAALVTRSKKEEISRNELFSRWRHEALNHGVTPSVITSLLSSNKYEVKKSPETDLSPKYVMNKLVCNYSTVSELQVLQKTAIEAQGLMCAEDVENYTLDMLNSDSVVKISNSKSKIDKDWMKSGYRYTTPETIRIEYDMFNRVDKMKLNMNHSVSDSSLELSRKKYQTISKEQSEVLELITNGSGAVAVIQGLAGAGKSYLMGAAREAWECDGYQVIGTAISNQATNNLSKESHIKSFNTTKLAIEIENGGVVINEKTIIVVDEAGMQSTHSSASLIQRTEEAGAKIVFVGDTRQLQAIDAGSPMRAIAERIGYFELKEVRRQRDVVSKKIALLFREGRSKQALELLEDRNQLHVSNSMNMAKIELAKSYIGDIDKGKSALCVAATRAEVRDLNQSIRDNLKRDGKISNEGYVVSTSAGYREFSIGDKIIFGERFNFSGASDEATNVWNGATGKVQAIERFSYDSVCMKVLLNHSAKVVSFKSHDMNKIDHGYASTVHKAQGSTVDCCHVLAGERTGREWTYVAGSRHRESVNFYTSTEYVSELFMRMSKAQQKDMAIDYMEESNVINISKTIERTESSINGKITNDNVFSI